MAEYNLGRVAFFDKGAYSPEDTYNKWDFVTTVDSTYLFIGTTPQIGKPVTDTNFWKCIANGKPATLAAAAADLAKEVANSAATLANDKAALSQSAATLANTKAGLANDAAILATEKAALADSKATLANDKAVLAQSAADNANTKAGLADAASILATDKAGLADSKATLANDKAALAQTAADNANTKAGLANNATIAANDAAIAANSAATLANDKAALADSKATLANDKAALAQTAADNANTKAGLANDATIAANNATIAANNAAIAANSAATLANDKAELADSKATLANDKATLAQTAADNANLKIEELSDFKQELDETIQNFIFAEELYSYGVSFDITAVSPSCTRIGHMPFHASKPVHAEMKGCLVDSANGTVNGYLTNWSDFNLTGANGSVMVEMPDSYWKFGLNGNIFSVRTSKYPIQGYTFVKKHYHGAYEASLNRLTNTLHSVANTTVDFRGGSNMAEWDGTYRSQLGLPTTTKSRIDFQAAARAKAPTSTIWNITDFTRWNIVTWLAIIEYGTRDIQQAINPALDANGYSQGGLGEGVTNIDYDKWYHFNGNNPFIPCGYTNSLNNGTGQVAYTMPFEYDADGAANYAGVYSAGTAYTANQFVSSGALLYKCILNAPAGTALTNTTYYTAQTRTVTYANRYRGIELPFGHTWKWGGGINIKIQSVADGGRSEVYVTDNPANYTDINYTNYIFKGLMARTDGYINKMILGETGLLIPSEVGGTAGANAMWCDYNSTNIPATGTELLAVLWGGAAASGARAGFVCAASTDGPSSAYPTVGARLCLIP